MTERLKRVAIVGFCNDSREMAPYEDETIEIWGLNRAYLFMHRANRWFDLHSPAIQHNQHRRPGKHLDWLKAFPGPVYMHGADPDIPNSVTFPLAEVAETIGSTLVRMNDKGQTERGPDAPYLTSSIAMEIALAIHEGYEEIQLWGIDLNTDSEYAWQKPGVEYLIGVALGRGIRVVLPDNCPLLRGSIYGRGYLSPTGEQMSMEQLEARSKGLEHDRNQLVHQLAELTGAKRELHFVMDQMVPGLDHERMDERLKRMAEGIGQLQQRLMQIEGAMKELAYWIHQTPAGQAPAEAIDQIRSNGHSDAEGPISDLALMLAPEDALPEALAVGV